VELLSKSPLLVQLYDLVTPGEAKQIIDFAEPRLQNYFPATPKNNNKATTSRAWRGSFLVNVSNDECSACRRLSFRIHQITKLETGGSLFRLLSYTYGAAISVHHDAVTGTSRNEKNNAKLNHKLNRISFFCA